MDRFPHRLMMLLTLTTALGLTACETTESHHMTDADAAADATHDALTTPDFDTQTAQPHAAGEHPEMVQILPPPRTRIYTVRRNDTLWKIAQQAYGDGQRWKDIVAANDGLDPARLRVGQQLVLPE